MALAAGDLRHFVVIQRPRAFQNEETGELETCWVMVAQVYAQIVPSSVREFTAAAAEQSEASGRIVIRYRDDVDATMRIVHRGRAYQILGVLPDPMSGLEYLTLPVATGVRVA